jgi:RNA polymerase sigma-70 factor (ECF subfamily)
MPENELATWIRFALQGNRQYQKQIYDLLAIRIYRVVRSIVGADHADDVTQDFFIHLFSRLSQFRFESSLETWAHRMAVNQSLQYLRKQKRDEARIEKWAQMGEMVSDANPHRVTEDAEMFERAMKMLSGEQRALLHMKEVDGLAYSSIAHTLNIPEGTVGSRLNKARSDLKNSLMQMGWEPS